MKPAGPGAYHSVHCWEPYHNLTVCTSCMPCNKHAAQRPGLCGCQCQHEHLVLCILSKVTACNAHGLVAAKRAGELLVAHGTQACRNAHISMSCI